MNEPADTPSTPAPLASLSKILTIVLAVDAVLWAVGLLVAQHRLSAVNAIPSGEWSSNPDAVNAKLNGPYQAELAVSLLGVVTLVVTAVVFIMWMYRARQNADIYRGSAPRLGTYWAVAGWLVPLADLVLPLLVMLGIWRDSEVNPRMRVSPVTWWVTLVLAVLAKIASVADWASNNPNDYPSAAMLDMFSALMLVMSAVFAIFTLRMVTAWQNHRNEELAKARRPKSKKARRRPAAAAG